VHEVSSMAVMSESRRLALVNLLVTAGLARRSARPVAVQGCHPVRYLSIITTNLV
jgi:hypothetical protein